MIPSLILLCVGALICVIGTIMLLIAAFRESVLWGLVVFFAPCGNIIYACVHWSEAKVGFLASFIGFFMMIGGIVLSPEARKGVMASISKEYPGLIEPEKKEPTPADMSAQIFDKRKTLEDLQAAFVQVGNGLPAQYQALEKRRAGLKTGDEAAITKFNADAAAYQARNQQHKAIQQQITKTQTELDQLIDARSRAAASNRPGSASTASGKQVVMYTTATCPACKVAKQYLAQKGIPYQEINVESNADGREAFRRLGGTGVPLITVGDKKMTGFNSQEFDRMML